MRLMRCSRASHADADGRQLRDRSGELSLVHLVAPFSSGRCDVHQPDPVEDAEMLGDGLAGDR